MGTLFLYKRELNNILPTTMLSYLVTYKSSVTAYYIEVISDIKFQFLILHYEKYIYKINTVTYLDI